jgi:hypothetical protein
MDVKSGGLLSTVLTTFWIFHKIFGLNPLPYHFVNVIIHAASAAVLWRVLRRLNVRGAWLGAALWTLHPVMGAVGRVDHGIEEHAVVPVLPADDSVLSSGG